MIDPSDKGKTKLYQTNSEESPSTSFKNPEFKSPEKGSKISKKRPHKNSNKKTTSSDSDEDLSKAYDQSVKEDSLLPILKQELRLKIQTRRLSEGQGELLPEREEPKVYELTEEEREKYRRRLLQNRDSLRRSRQKEIEREEILKQTFDMETSKEESLKRQKLQLLTEREELMRRLREAGMDVNENTSSFICKGCKQTIKYPS
ncbi:reticulocyte-binding protein homolog 2a-like [Mytilus californianus]|uniref:reticulocyte-binding protein homolog 2a-like n=1 Tax=Mytilus californianus TaxID=6549 RepID=UPI0022477041|nr:reticulocyte-binding protein homolog 2a-like [Mytilus californianus]